MKRVVLLCALALPMAVAAQANDQWYLNPQFGGISADHQRGTPQNKWLFGIGLGRELNSYLDLELNLNNGRLQNSAGTEHYRATGTSLDLLGVANRAGRLSPYALIGLGALSESFQPGPSNTNFMAEAGVGMRWSLWRSQDLSDGFALRPEIKARWDNPVHCNCHLVDVLYTLGFQYSFGGTPLATPAPPPPPPAPPPPVAIAAPAPTPPPVTPVILDSDHDGVPDSIDQCPNTPPGVQVDAVGCPLKGSITLEGVNFEFNSAQLTTGSIPILDKVAAGLSQHRRVKVELQGHTDSTGTAAYNLKLSQRRAAAVESYLIAQGVDASQLVSKGYGLTRPVATNDTDAGRARNRRVVMLVLENPGDVPVDSTRNPNAL